MSAMNADEVSRRIREGAAKGLNLVALRVQARTIPLTPLEYGDLRSSIVTIDASPSDLRSAVASDSPYAVAQHERLDYRHDDGQAKYLENATRASRDEVGGILQQAVEKRLRG